MRLIACARDSMCASVACGAGSNGAKFRLGDDARPADGVWRVVGQRGCGVGTGVRGSAVRHACSEEGVVSELLVVASVERHFRKRSACTGRSHAIAVDLVGRSREDILARFRGELTGSSDI